MRHGCVCSLVQRKISVLMIWCKKRIEVKGLYELTMDRAFLRHIKGSSERACQGLCGLQREGATADIDMLDARNKVCKYSFNSTFLCHRIFSQIRDRDVWTFIEETGAPSPTYESNNPKTSLRDLNIFGEVGIMECCIIVAVWWKVIKVALEVNDISRDRERSIFDIQKVKSIKKRHLAQVNRFSISRKPLVSERFLSWEKCWEKFGAVESQFSVFKWSCKMLLKIMAVPGFSDTTEDLPVWGFETWLCSQNSHLLLFKAARYKCPPPKSSRSSDRCALLAIAHFLK